MVKFANFFIEKDEIMLKNLFKNGNKFFVFVKFIKRISQ